MWLLSASSTQIHHGSEVEPCNLSFHSKSGIMLRWTFKTVRVIGWMLAAKEIVGKAFTRFRISRPILTWETRCPASKHSNDYWHRSYYVYKHFRLTHLFHHGSYPLALTKWPSLPPACSVSQGVAYYWKTASKGVQTSIGGDPHTCTWWAYGTLQLADLASVKFQKDHVKYVQHSVYTTNTLRRVHYVRQYHYTQFKSHI